MKDSCKRTHWMYMALAVPWTILLFVASVQSQDGPNSSSLETLLNEIKLADQQYTRLRQETDLSFPELKEYEGYLEELQQQTRTANTPEEVVAFYQAFADPTSDARHRQQILSFLNEAQDLASSLWLSGNQIDFSKKVKVYKTVCSNEETTRNLSRSYRVNSSNPSDIAGAIIQAYEKNRERIVARRQRLVQNNGYLSASATLWLLDYDAACFAKNLARTAIDRMKPEELKEAEEKLGTLNSKLGLLAPDLLALTAAARREMMSDPVVDDLWETLPSTDIAAHRSPPAALEATTVTQDPGKGDIVTASLEGSDTSIEGVSNTDDSELEGRNAQAAPMPVTPDKKHHVTAAIWAGIVICAALGLIMYSGKNLMKSTRGSLAWRER